MQIVLSVKELSKVFQIKKDSLEVVKNINMEIEDKEIICILGPSGCGKSTFLKILGGIMPATSGSLKLGDEEFGSEIPSRALKKFGFVFQNDNLLPWRNAAKNLGLTLEMMKIKDENSDNRIMEMMEIVGLQDYLYVYPYELSGGMRQRVGIARALVHNPEILLMDQPLGALDAITRKMLSYEILNIWKKTQKTIVMVTNNVGEALLLANRVYLFSSLPATIVREFQVDIPLDERGPQIVYNKVFNELRDEINALTREYEDNCTLSV